MSIEDDFWLIDSNCVGVIRFIKNDEIKNDYMIIEEGIIMGIHCENAPLMKTRKQMQIEDARLLWQNLLKEGWKKTNSKW